MTSPFVDLLQENESETVEFKAGRAGIAAVARAVCGMVNQRGGIVLWGVDDPRKPTGFERAEERAQELNGFLMQRMSPRPLLSVSVNEVAGRRLIAVEVPMGMDKPYSLDRAIWVRIGTSTLRASADQGSRIVDDSATRLKRWERETMPGFFVEECDRAELALARQEIGAKGRFGIDVPNDDLELLTRLYLARNGQLSNGAAVLFARQPRVWAPNLALRVVSYANDRTGPVSNDLTFEGPAIRILKEAIEAIQRRTGFSTEFNRGNLRRNDQPAYALYALREGLVNALAHRSYERAGAGVEVEIYPGYLVIRNPGRLPEGWTEKDLVRKHESRPANPDIARVFYLRELMDQLGLGAHRIVEECRKLGAKAPVWEASHGVVALTVYAAPEPKGERRLTQRQAKFVSGITADTYFKANDYMRAVEVSERQARRDLRGLEKIGVVERVGAGRATSYRFVGSQI